MEYKDELTQLERRLVECAAAGDELDCAPTGATAAKLDEIDDWNERIIRAEVLVALCTGEVSDWPVHPRRGLRLRGAYIAGQVDLSRAQMTQCPLAFHTCYFAEDFVLYQATTSDLRFTSCVLHWLNGNELNSSASLHLTETRLQQISLVSASFRGKVELSNVHLLNRGGDAIEANDMSAIGVHLHGTHVEGEVRLLGATLSGQLTFDQGTKLLNRGKTLIADRISAKGVFLHSTHVVGEVKFSGANLVGQLYFGPGTTLSNPSRDALIADGMSASSVHLHGTHVEGEVRLVGAKLSGQLYFGPGTTLRNLNDCALKADGISASDVFLSGTHVEGQVTFLSANLSGELTCDQGTSLSISEGYALKADGMSASTVTLRGTHVVGGVRLVGAKLSGQLGCGAGTTLSNVGGFALNADWCQVEGALVFRLKKRAVGIVSLAYAQIGTLDDDLASWPETYKLVGFSYHSLGGDDDLPERLKWLSNSKPFSPHVYSQLAEVYLRSGHEGYARRVAISREEERGRQPDLSLWVRAWKRFLGLTVAYGYQPWQALVPLVVLFVLGWFLFTLPPAQEVMVHPSPNIKGPISAAACHKSYPCFSPPIYVLDTLLPIIDLHQESNWVPARPRPWGVWYEVLTWVLIAAGWILTTAVVAGIGSLLRKE